MKNSVNYKTNWSQVCSNNLQTLICLPNESQTIFSILKSASQTTIYYSNESLNNLSFKRVTNYNLIIFYYLNKSICQAFCCSNNSQITGFSFKWVTNYIWVFDFITLFVGEFMQLGSKENENERFSHYLRKCYKKTASLIANSCKAVSTRLAMI